MDFHGGAIFYYGVDLFFCLQITYRNRAPRLAIRKRLSLLGVSDAVRDDMRKCLPKWPTGRINTLYNRIDIDAVQAGQLSGTPAREALGLSVDGFIVGNVGRLHPDKDQATLLRGFAQALPGLPAGARLAILGKGRLEEALKALAVELGIAGQVRIHDISDNLARRTALFHQRFEHWRSQFLD